MLLPTDIVPASVRTTRCCVLTLALAAVNLKLRSRERICIASGRVRSGRKSSGRITSGLLCLAVMFLSPLPALAQDSSGRYISDLVVNAPDFDRQSFTAARELVVELEHKDIAALESFIGSTNMLTSAGSKPGRLRVTAPRRAVINRMPVLDAHLEASFVIDFDEPVVEQLVARYRQSAAADASVASLTQFVDSMLPNKTYARGFDIASRAAARGEGDCTEHAVLLTAASRAVGKPARTVMGAALVGYEDGLAGYGHAWTEIFVDGQWRLADATGISRELPVFYLPLGVITEEGPGYAFGLFEAIQRMPSRITLVSMVP